jgi:hypothetical protein
MNKVSKEESTYTRRELNLMPWRQKHNELRQIPFAYALQRVSEQVPTPSTFRVLENETDAKLV